MTSQSITFVLGAGASNPYGFPLGWELNQQLNAPGLPLAEFEAMGYSCVADMEECLRAFRASGSPSIDSFVAKRREFADVCKPMIAYLILHAERNSIDRFMGFPSGDWYRYFLHAINRDECAFKDLDFSEFGVVTFNYDRSLEYFLATALVARYVCSWQEAIEKLSTMPIVHVYGSIGSLDRESSEHVPYGCSHGSHQHFRRAIQGLQLIPEGRDSDDVLPRARHLISKARTVAILGFGFDRDNLARIDYDVTCKREFQESFGVGPRKVVASTMKCTPAFVSWLTYKIRTRHEDYETVKKGFRDLDALELLREELIFGEGM